MGEALPRFQCVCFRGEGEWDALRRGGSVGGTIASATICGLKATTDTQCLSPLSFLNSPHPWVISLNGLPGGVIQTLLLEVSEDQGSQVICLRSYTQ